VAAEINNYCDKLIIL